MVINTNMGSLNAVRLLDESGREQKTSMERLTSGLRINRAADDAAGLAVTTAMTSQIRGTDMAIKNANDGISLVQTLDGASDEVVSMLQRMRELSIQSLNGTYSSENRRQMDEEYQQLTNEIDRVAKTTKFNDTTLMSNYSTDGTANSAQISAGGLHVGWQAGEDNKVAISAANFHTSTISGFNSNLSALNSTISQAGIGSAGTLLYGVAKNEYIGSASPASNATVFIGKTLGQTDIKAESAASIAVQILDGAISNIGTYRAKWGALQNRLESTISNLSNVNENMNAARSRIQDTDFARESANLARTQVLQQAGMSMLSQANQSSQNVLQLLQ